MPRGKKTSQEDIYRIMVSWSVTQDCAQTAKDLDIPASTVSDIVKRNKDNPEFVEIRSKKKKEFEELASDVIDDGMKLLKKRFRRALEHEEQLDALIAEIYAADKEDLSQDEKNRLVAKIKALQLQDVKAVTTAVGTLFDKRALARGESTGNTSVIVKLPPGVDEYAG